MEGMALEMPVDFRTGDMAATNKVMSYLEVMLLSHKAREVVLH